MSNQKFGSILSSSTPKQNKEAKDEIIGLIARNNRKEITILLTSDYEATASCVVAFTKRILKNEMNTPGVKFPFELFSFDEIESDIKDVIIDKSS